MKKSVNVKPLLIIFNASIGATVGIFITNIEPKLVWLAPFMSMLFAFILGLAGALLGIIIEEDIQEQLKDICKELNEQKTD